MDRADRDFAAQLGAGRLVSVSRAAPAGARTSLRSWRRWHVLSDHERSRAGGGTAALPAVGCPRHRSWVHDDLRTRPLLLKVLGRRCQTTRTIRLDFRRFRSIAVRVPW